MQVCGPLSSEKKELLRRDYARAMSDKLCDKTCNVTHFSGDHITLCRAAKNGQERPCRDFKSRIKSTLALNEALRDGARVCFLKRVWLGYVQ
jgi:hypothetical protein